MILIAMLLVATLCFVLYFMRSSKEMPKSWRELVLELKFQYYGARGFVEDVLTSFKNKVDLIELNNKVVVMTGGNRGIGLCVLEKLLKCGMTVILGVRDPTASQKSVEGALGLDLTKEKVFYEKCDTADLETVREFARKVQEKFPAVHVLINNAGILGTPYKVTKDGFESQMATNYLGHFLLTHLLMPQLIAGSTSDDKKNARVINVSSCVHKAGDIDYDDFHCKNFYYPADSYCKSKLAQVLFTKSLDGMCKERLLKVQCHAVHPGIVDTDLFSHTSSDYFPWLKRMFYKTPEQGSRSIVDAAISPKHEGQGGSYLTNCTSFSYHKSADDIIECSKLFKFTCDLLKIDNFNS